MESLFLQASAYAGIAATIALTLNYLFGMMVGTAYQRSSYWKKIPKNWRNINIYNWHNRTAYVALVLVVVHPLLLLFDPSTKFTFIDLIFPINAPTQRLFVALGTIAFFAILLVIITSQKAVKQRMTFRTWKNIHLISYGTALLFIVHGIVMDPQLKDRPVDLLDAEKIASEACLLLLIAATVYRVRYEISKRKTTRFYKLRVAKILDETSDAKTFVLAIPPKLIPIFNYLPGQFILLKFMINGEEYKRAYSLSSCPYTDSLPQFTVKRIAGGLVSNYINDTLREGDLIWVFPPSGFFFKEAEMGVTKKILLFAGGSGITPLYSISKALLTKYPNTHINLLYANRSTGSIIFFKELEELQKNNPQRFTITHILSKAAEGWSGMKGRLDKDKLNFFLEATNHLPVLHTQYYICGPSPFMELAEHELMQYGIPDNRIHIERFVSIGSSEEPIKMGDATETANLVQSNITIQLEGAVSTVVCSSRQTLLEAFLASGINAPYSCKEGVCSTCKAKLLTGKVEMKKHASLTEIDIHAKQILTCQAVPLSQNIKIDYDAAR